MSAMFDPRVSLCSSLLFQTPRLTNGLLQNYAGLQAKTHEVKQLRFALGRAEENNRELSESEHALQERAARLDAELYARKAAVMPPVAQQVVQTSIQSARKMLLVGARSTDEQGGEDGAAQEAIDKARDLADLAAGPQRSFASWLASLDFSDAIAQGFHSVLDDGRGGDDGGGNERGGGDGGGDAHVAPPHGDTLELSFMQSLGGCTAEAAQHTLEAVLTQVCACVHAYCIHRHAYTQSACMCMPMPPSSRQA